MAINVVGLFDAPEQAQAAVQRLIAGGIDSSHISLVAADPAGSGTIVRETVTDTSDMTNTTAVSGAGAGLVFGAIVGLLVGASTIVVPGAGFLLAGPIVGMMAGAGLGMAGGTLVGALAGLGIPEGETHIYAEGIRRGATLVTASVEEIQRTQVEQIFAMAGAVNISERAIAYRQGGFTEYDPALPIYSPDEAVVERNRYAVPPPVISDALFQDDYQTNYASAGTTFEMYRPAYSFGYKVATRPEFRGLDWSVIEPQVRTLWEGTNPNSWETYRSAIQTGWLKATTPVPVVPVNNATVL